VEACKLMQLRKTDSILVHQDLNQDIGGYALTFRQAWNHIRTWSMVFKSLWSSLSTDWLAKNGRVPESALISGLETTGGGSLCIDHLPAIKQAITQWAGINTGNIYDAQTKVLLLGFAKNDFRLSNLLIPLNFVLHKWNRMDFADPLNQDHCSLRTALGSKSR